MNLHSSPYPAYAAAANIDIYALYSHALESVMDGQPLAKTLTGYIRQLEVAIPRYRFAVSQFIESQQRLLLLTSPSIEGEFCNAISEQRIADKHTACTLAISRQSPFFIERLASYPGWKNYTSSMAQTVVTSVTSYWSFPLVLGNQCLGTLAVFGSHGHQPDSEAVMFYQRIAGFIAKIFSYCETCQEKTKQQWQLTSDLKAKDKDFTLLQSKFNALQQDFSGSVHQLTHHKLPAGFASLSDSLLTDLAGKVDLLRTSADFMRTESKQNRRFFEQNQLKRSALARFYEHIDRAGRQSIIIADRAAQSLGTLRHLIDDVAENPIQDVEIGPALQTILDTLSRTRPSEDIIGCFDFNSELILHLPTGSFTQVISELFYNIIQHAYGFSESVRIYVKATLLTGRPYKQLSLIVSDKGRGLPQRVLGAINPTQNASHSALLHSGGGLRQCYREVETVLGGSMVCESQSGYGTTFSMRIPLKQEVSQR